MKHNDLLVYEPGNQYPAPGEVAPFTTLPVWWRSFIFQVLSPREFAVYMYLAMKMDSEHSIAYPTAKEIQGFLGLKSDSAIFEAIAALEEKGFLLRRNLQLPNRTSRLSRNIYQRAAPEYTLLRLLNRTGPEGKPGDNGIDEFLRYATYLAPEPLDPNATTEVPRDAAAGLKRLLETELYNEYAFAPDGDKRHALKTGLEQRLSERMKQGGEKYSAGPKEAPRDRQRREAREREIARAQAGGVKTPNPFVDFEDEIPF